MGREVAITSCSLSANKLSGGIPGSFVKIPIMSVMAKTGGKPTLIKKLPYIATGCNYPGQYVFIFGNGVVNATCPNTKVDNLKPLRKDDGQMFDTCSGTFVSTADGSTQSCSCNVYISDAGQNNVKAE